MVERQISPPEEIKEKYQKVGVVIFVLNQNNEVLVVRENSDNQPTGKESGSFGVICETSNEGESWGETVIRGLKEELGIDAEPESVSFQINPGHCFLGESLFVEGVLARVVVLHWTGDDDIFFTSMGDGEVSAVCWGKPGDLLSYPLRIGVRKILQECLDEGLLEIVGGISEKNLLPLSIANLEAQEKNFDY